MSELSKIKPIHSWFQQKLNIHPIVIAGPCSAESEEQLRLTAQQLHCTNQVQILRAGIWKPRTRPNSFEGKGSEALQWLNKAKADTNLLSMVEVASPKHVEMCLRHNVDILWIGARTTSNPFSMQELASALQGMNVPVMVKNPINPDIKLWIGALERINKAGITKLAAIHRGFYPFEKTVLRNIPKWEIPIELKSCFRNLPIICDPSHIAGSANYVQEIAQKAMDLGMDGLMIESHICPHEALSDAKQQVSPEELSQILQSLVCRLNIAGDDENAQLNQYRDKIDSIDSQLIELLAQRMKVVKEIGNYKSKKNMTILQLERWEEVHKNGVNLAKTLGLSEKLISQLFRIIHKEAISWQNEVMNQ